MTWQPDPTTTTSTVPETTVPSTTVPETTIPEPLPEGCIVGEFDVVCVDTPPETTTPETTTTVVVGCVPGEFPQGPTGNEPCGPTDLCSGDGATRNWSLLPCDTIPATETTVAVAEPVPTLPATGGETGWIALVGTVMILTGISLVSMVKGRRA
jgi:LPXTG-motif cell wall-anchored protein